MMLGSPIQRRAASALVLAAALVSTAAIAGDALVKRVQTAREVYEELLAAPDRSVPKKLLEDCRCVAVIPRVFKGAIGWGARHGKGIISCRNAEGVWSPIAFLNLTGGSFGFQIGAEATDFVLFFMTSRGARSLLESKFTLGGTVSVAAGPEGRSAEASTDVKLGAEIYSYAKSKGLFAGISLEGARLAPDRKAIAEYYGKEASAESLLFGRERPELPASAQAFLKSLP